MSIEWITVLMIGLFMAILAAGLPLAFATGAVAVIFAIGLFGVQSLNLIVSRVFTLMGNYVLVSVPLFILMACILERAGVAARIKMLVGNSLELINRVEGEFDLIFNDVDKHDYPEVLRLAVPRLRKGGLFITDNVFWSGRVARRAADKNTRAIQEFNRLLYSSPDLWTTLLPLRDGLAVCLKL